MLDCEAVAWDRETKSIQPFQVLSTRKRKDAVDEEIKVQVCLFAFDLLYLNGEALVRKSFKERRELLRNNFNLVENEFGFAKSVDGKTTEEIQEALEESIKGKISKTATSSCCLLFRLYVVSVETNRSL